MVRRLALLSMTLALALSPMLAQPPTDNDEIDPDVIERLIQQLGSPDFGRRQQAMVELREIDAAAIPFLRKHINHPDNEVRQRVRELIPKLEKSAPMRTCVGHDKPVIALAMLPGKQVLSASEDRTLRRWDLGTGKELECFEGHAKQVWCVAVAPDGRSFISGGQDCTVREWPLAKDGPKRQLATLGDSVRCLLYLPGGKQFLAGALDAKIYLIDVQTGNVEKEWLGQHDAVLCLALSPDGTRVLSGGGYRDASICVRDARTGEILRRLTKHAEHVCAVAYVDANHAVSAGYDLTIRLWDLRTGEVIRTFSGHKRVVYALAVSSDGRRLFSAGYDNHVRVWDLATGEEIRRYEQHTDGVNAIALSQDGRTVVSASNDRTMLLWSIPRRVKASK